MAELRGIATNELFDELIRRCVGDELITRELYDIRLKLDERERNARLLEGASDNWQRKFPQRAYRRLIKNADGHFYWIHTAYTYSNAVERFDKYIPRAIEKGYMTVTDTGAIWETVKAGIRGGRTELALFVFYLFDRDSITRPNGKPLKTPYGQFGKIFGVEHLANLVSTALDRVENPKRYHNNTKAFDIRLKREIFYD